MSLTESRPSMMMSSLCLAMRGALGGTAWPWAAVQGMNMERRDEEGGDRRGTERYLV